MIRADQTVAEIRRGLAAAPAMVFRAFADARMLAFAFAEGRTDRAAIRLPRRRNLSLRLRCPRRPEDDCQRHLPND